jgi:hypothetical protein
VDAGRYVVAAGGGGVMTTVQWQNGQGFWLAALTVVAVLTAVVWFYRPQVKPVRAPWWWVLLGLRAVALGVLALSILKPVVLRPLGEEQRGVVAVLIDQSASMSVADFAQAPPARLVQLADALGALPQGSRPVALESLRQRIAALAQLAERVDRADSEMDYALLSGRGIESAAQHLRESRETFARVARGVMQKAASIPETAELSPEFGRLAAGAGETSTPEPSVPQTNVSQRIAQLAGHVDAIQSVADEALHASDASVRAACDELAKQPRIELVRRALNGPSGLLAALGRERVVLCFGFSPSVKTINQPIEQLDATGATSDLGGAWRALRQRLGARRVAAGVIFTDGRQVGGDTGFSSGPLGFGGLGPSSDAPVLAVSVSAPVPATRDIAIQRVSMPTSVFVGETAYAQIELRAAGFNNAQTEVSLDSGDARLRQTTGVTIADGSARVELPLRLDHSGPQRVTISVRPIAGELTDRNNSVTRDVKVISDRISVALIGGLATWDFQHLRAALARAPAFALTHELLDGRSRESRASIPPTEILDQDVLVLSDVRVDSLDGQQWDAVGRLVNDRGGSVIIIASDPSAVSSYAMDPLAAALLPWRGDTAPALRVWPGEEPEFGVIPNDQDIADALSLTDDTDGNRSLWNQLPRVYRILSIPPLKANTRELLVERDSESPILTESRVGVGRSLMLGIGEAWRWRAALDERARDRFWLQLVRYAAVEPYAVTDGKLWLDADQLRVEPGRPLRVRAKIRHAESIRTPDADAVDPAATTPAITTATTRDARQPEVQLLRAGAHVRSEPLSPVIDGSPDRFETTLFDLVAGEYVIRLTSDRDPGRWISLPVRVAESDEAELRDLSGDIANLRRLVGPRGQVLSLSDVKGLPQRIDPTRDIEHGFTEFRLWDSPYLFLFVLGCLGAEWAVRKIVGLV